MKQLLITIAAVVFTGTLFADPIHDYAWGNLLSGVNKELSNGIDVNTKNNIGDTPFVISTHQGYEETAEFIRKNGGTTNEELFIETHINFKRNPFEFNFYTVKGFHYPIQGSKDLKNWETFEVVEGNDRITVFRDQRVLGLSSYFYRVKVAPNN